MGILEKQLELSNYIPGYPPTPAEPGYYVEEATGESCGTHTTRKIVGYNDKAYDAAMKRFQKELQAMIDGKSSVLALREPKRSDFAIYGYSQEYSCKPTGTGTRKRWVAGKPAKPGKAPVIEFDAFPGWNAGAVSIAEWGPWADDEQMWSSPGLADYIDNLPPSFTFTLPSNNVGVVVGLTYKEHPTSPNDILLGVRVDGGKRYSWVNHTGAAWDWSDVLPAAVILSFRLDVYDNGVEIYTDDADGGGCGAYTFDGAWLTRPGLRLGAVMYFGGDRVLDAKAHLPGGVQVLGAVDAVAGVAWDGAFTWAQEVLPAVQGQAGEFAGGAAVLPPVLANGFMSGLYDAGGFVELPPVVGSGNMESSEDLDGIVLGYQIGAFVPGVYAVGETKAGWNARQEGGGLSPIQAIGGEGSYGVQDVGLLAPVETYAFANPMDAPTQVGSVAFADSYFLQQTQLAVALNSQGQVLGIFDFSLLMQAQLEAKADALSTWEFEAELLAYIDSAIRAGGDWGATWATAAGADYDFDNQVGQVWVLNARTGALSRYVNYSFNSFAKIGGYYFGAAPDGIYLLGGDKDGTEPVMSRVRTGELDLGSKQLKRVSNVYLAVSSEDELDLTVIVGADQYTYKARRADPYSQQQRVDTGKGMRATNYAFELVNSTPYELDGMDINVAQSARRI